jgi:hypothetical protein
MTSKVYERLKLRDGGLIVEVAGPIQDWEPDEASASFSVQITQTHAGTDVVASGDSTMTYYPGRTEWSALAEVDDTTTPLQEGRARALATATITLASGDTEEYVWGLPVELLRNPGPIHGATPATPAGPAS